MPLPSAPKRQDTKVFPTPLIGDVLFSQIEDCSRKDFPEYGTPHPDTAKWPHHKLVFIRAVDNQREGIHEFFYAADRDNQDLYNWEFTKADIGGQNYDAVSRTYVLPREGFTPQVPIMGSTMPDIPSGLFTGSYVMIQRRQSRIGEQTLDSLYVADVRVYAKRCTMKNIGTDELNGKALYSTETLYYGSEVVLTIEGEGEDPDVTLTAAQLFADPTNSFWGLQEDGYENSGKQLSCEWYVITRRQVVAGTLTDGVVDVGAYNTNQRYYWPAVLGSYELMDWERNDGGTDIYPKYTFEPDAYNGPCRALVERTWSKTPISPLTVLEPMLPTPIGYACPYFTLSVPECLHAAVVSACDTSSSDPVYVTNVGSARTTPATNYLTWPASIVASDEQDPYRGGYLRTKVTVYPPPTPASPPSYSAALPTVSAISPNTGTSAGGTLVTITGTNFTNVTSVRIGGVSAAFAVDSPTQITATTPAGVAGARAVVVATWASSSGSVTFTYT
jgi:hypothetical protein